ncbi:MAG: hypothetical protein AB7G12_12825 [Thermoanaerobaculia bacterium]
MQDPQLNADGTVKNITRVEFEPLGNGSYRWNLFAGDARIHSEVGRDRDLERIFATTLMMCTCPDFEPHDERNDDGEGSSPGSETDQMA